MTNKNDLRDAGRSKCYLLKVCTIVLQICVLYVHYFHPV